jgi:hypothetical protein
MDNYNRKHWAHTHKILWITKVFVVIVARISRQGGKRLIGAMLGVGHRTHHFRRKNSTRRFWHHKKQPPSVLKGEHACCPNLDDFTHWHVKRTCHIFFFPPNYFMSIQFSHGFKPFFIWSPIFLITLQFNHEFHPICG